MKPLALAALLLAAGPAMAQPQTPRKEHPSADWFKAHPGEMNAVYVACRDGHTVADVDCVNMHLARVDMLLDEITTMLAALKAKQ